MPPETSSLKPEQGPRQHALASAKFYSLGQQADARDSRDGAR